MQGCANLITFESPDTRIFSKQYMRTLILCIIPEEELVLMPGKTIRQILGSGTWEDLLVNSNSFIN
jgi:hypothetical protein